MNTEAFFKHWHIDENPFRAEEAKDDDIFQRLIDQDSTHPDFDKIYGQPESPAPAVVFGEKGSGKTAIRMQIDRKIKVFNFNNPSEKIWTVHYDDLNPILDRFHRSKTPLKEFRLEDHMDGILSVSTTRLLDFLFGERVIEPLPARKARRKIRRMGPQKRLDLATLAVLYDHPVNSIVSERWSRVRRMLRYGTFNWARFLPYAALVTTVAAMALNGFIFWKEVFDWKLVAGAGASTLAAVVLIYLALRNAARYGRLARQIRKEVRVIDRDQATLKNLLGHLRYRAFINQPVPLPGDQDSRYQLFSRLMNILRELGYTGMLVLIDRIDEPTLVKGEPGRMKHIIWPLLDNKFLQQPGIGVKMLLPIELAHMLRREDAAFYQKARLDKQSMIDPLQWSGATLYDLCTRRLNSCRDPESGKMTLCDLFADDVSRQDLVDALDQMHQPRDAFKLVYQIIHEHCLRCTEQEGIEPVPRLTLEHVRREQSQRLQDLYRGLTPA